MKLLRHCLIVLLGILVCANAIAQKKFELEDIAKLVSVADPQISPDAKSIVIVVSRPDYMQNRYNAALVQVDIATGKQTTLTHDRPNVSQPRWSPGGDQLAFLAKAGQAKDATNQVFLLSIAGGEARQLTKAPRGVQHYAWSPDASAIAYVTSDEPANKAELEKGHSFFEVGNNDMFVGTLPTPSHIWLVKTANGEQRRLTSGNWTIPVTIPPSSPASPLSWSADGKSILLVKSQSPYSGDGLFRTIQLLNVADTTMRPLTSRTQMELYPLFSPDGTSIAYWYKRGGKNSNVHDIWITTPSGGEGKNMTEAIDRELCRVVWMPDGKSFLTGGHDDNKTSMWLQTVSGTTTKIDLGNVSPNWGFWIDPFVGKNGSIAFTGTEPMQPTELYYLSSTKAKPVKLTDFNAEVKAMAFGQTATIRWENDSFQHCGIVTYPVGYEKEKTYPLVLVVHGGPNAASVEMFSRFAQLLANQGYLVFEPNYRGSDNLGSKYKQAIVQNAGERPGRDVMAGLEKLKSMGVVDTSRMAVTGWSYGGFMTVWLAGHYAGWKAAVAGAAVTDMVDQYNLGDANVVRGGSLGGSPWTKSNLQNYIDQSPITAAANIKAPMLILANNADPRVPVTQSYKLFHLLKDNGIETKFYTWPIAAHNATDPVSQMDRDRLWIDWINKYLKATDK